MYKKWLVHTVASSDTDHGKSCCEHFTPEDFQRNMMADERGSVVVLLKPDAVPSVFSKPVMSTHLKRSLHEVKSALFYGLYFHCILYVAY